MNGGNRMKFMVCGFGNPEEHAYLPYLEKYGIGLELQSYGLKGSLSQAAWDERIELHRAVRQNYQGRLAIHGPFLGMSYNYKDHLLKEAIRKRMDMTYDVVSEFKPDTLVMHTGMTSEVTTFKFESEWISDLTEFWKTEIKKYEDIGVTVVLENIIEETPDLMIELIDRIGHPNMGICLDIGHFNICGKISINDWICRLGSRLRHVHAHDNHGTRDEHLPLGEGTIDFDGFFAILSKITWDVTVSLEINSTPQKVLQNVKYVLERYGHR